MRTTASPPTLYPVLIIRPSKLELIPYVDSGIIVHLWLQVNSNNCDYGQVLEVNRKGQQGYNDCEQVVGFGCLLLFLIHHRNRSTLKKCLSAPSCSDISSLSWSAFNCIDQPDSGSWSDGQTEAQQDSMCLSLPLNVPERY